MRNSSVELFRIIATFLVLIVHFNGWFVGMPNKLSVYTLSTISQGIIESFSCICVNCFLVITGWYGVSFKWRHIWNIYSILVWIYVPCYILNWCVTDQFSILSFAINLFALLEESYYVQCYVMLLVLSPVLNSFIGNYQKKILPFVLAFWGIEIIFDWILGNKCLGFAHGFQLTHFILMYFLGQTAYLYRDNLRNKVSSTQCFCIFLLGVFLIAGMYTIISARRCFAYSNPINIIMSFSLFLIFERRTFHNKTINWISKSTLAVYILHCTPPFLNMLRDWDNYILIEYTYFEYLLIIFTTICLVFILGVLYDQIKNLFMPKIGDFLCGWLSKKTSKYAL